MRAPSSLRSATAVPVSPVTSDRYVPAQCPVTESSSQRCAQLQAGVHAPSHGVPVASPSHSSLSAGSTTPSPQKALGGGGDGTIPGSSRLVRSNRYLQWRRPEVSCRLDSATIRDILRLSSMWIRSLTTSDVSLGRSPSAVYDRALLARVAP